MFTSIAVKTLGPINSQGLEFLSDLGRRISQVRHDVRESAFLLQRLSVLIQRFAYTPTEYCRFQDWRNAAR